MSAVGILLAAGAGVRAGGPKALRVDASGSWLERGVHALRDGGCESAIVVLGAEADAARLLAPADATVVVASDWAEGMGASLRRGLIAAEATPASAAVITLVDLPGMPAAAIERVLSHGAGSGALRRAVYEGLPGHPVLVGRAHWSAVAHEVSGDRGARPYLRAHGVDEVECGDLWDGADSDY